MFYVNKDLRFKNVNSRGWLVRGGGGGVDMVLFLPYSTSGVTKNVVCTILTTRSLAANR